MVEVEFQTTKVLALFHIKIIIISICGPRIFKCVPTRRRDSLFYLFSKKLIFRKRLRVATYFCFIFEGKNKIRKKNPKCDS